MRLSCWYLIPLAYIATACDPTVHVDGVVSTASGTPLANVRVSLEVSGEQRVESTLTDSMGNFSITHFGSRRPPFELRICRDGYQATMRRIESLGALDLPLDIALEPAGPAAMPSPDARCLGPSRPAV